MKLKDRIEAVSTFPVNPWYWHDISWSGEEAIEHVLNIELSLFNEMFIYSRGMAWDENLESYFQFILKKTNPSLTEQDIKEFRDFQIKIIMEIYKRHYAAIVNNPKIKLYYYMFLQTTGILKSHKTDYILKLYGINPKNTKIHNAKYKTVVLQNIYNDFMSFWLNVGYNNLPSREVQKELNKTEIKQNDETLINTLIGFQEARGHNTYDAYIKEKE